MNLIIKYKNTTHSLECNNTITILELKEKIAILENISSNKLKIQYNETELIEGTLEENKILDQSILYAIRKTKIKNKCHVTDCLNKCVVIIGDCKWCSKSFCYHHRLHEAHNCSNYQQCKQSSFDKNASLVGNMKCVVSKV